MNKRNDSIAISLSESGGGGGGEGGGGGGESAQSCVIGSSMRQVPVGSEWPPLGVSLTNEHRSLFILSLHIILQKTTINI